MGRCNNNVVNKAQHKVKPFFFSLFTKCMLTCLNSFQCNKIQHIIVIKKKISFEFKYHHIIRRIKIKLKKKNNLVSFFFFFYYYVRSRVYFNYVSIFLRIY